MLHICFYGCQNKSLGWVQVQPELNMPSTIENLNLNSFGLTWIDSPTWASVFLLSYVWTIATKVEIILSFVRLFGQIPSVKTVEHGRKCSNKGASEGPTNVSLKRFGLCCSHWSFVLVREGHKVQWFWPHHWHRCYMNSSGFLRWEDGLIRKEEECADK